jgi:acyl-CoA dehydrogenase
MLLSILFLLLVTTAVFAVTQVGWLLTLLFVLAVLVLAYQRLSLLTFTLTFTLLFALYLTFGAPAGVWKGTLLLLLVVLWLLNVRPLRRAVISRPFLKTYLKLLPVMSQTEREALAAGGVWWDGELFTGKPDWSRLLAAKPATLTARSRPSSTGPSTRSAR